MARRTASKVASGDLLAVLGAALERIGEDDLAAGNDPSRLTFAIMCPSVASS